MIGAIWLAAAFLFESPALAGVAQVVGTAGVVLGVAGHCRHQDWWTGSLIEPLFLNWQLGALAVSSGLWIALRQFLRPWPVAARVLGREPVTVDRIVLGGVVALLAATCFLAAAPGILAQERSSPHKRAAAPAVLSVGRDALFDRGDRHRGPRVSPKTGHPGGGGLRSRHSGRPLLRPRAANRVRFALARFAESLRAGLGSGNLAGLGACRLVPGRGSLGTADASHLRRVRGAFSISSLPRRLPLGQRLVDRLGFGLGIGRRGVGCLRVVELSATDQPHQPATRLDGRRLPRLEGYPRSATRSSPRPALRCSPSCPSIC